MLLEYLSVLGRRDSLCKGPEVAIRLACQATERWSVWLGLSEQRGKWKEMRLERQEDLVRYDEEIWILE